VIYRKFIPIAMATALAASGCSSSAATPGAASTPGGSTSAIAAPSPTANYACGKLTVWMMQGTLTSQNEALFDDQFEASHPCLTVNFQEQDWDGIMPKLTTALSTNSGPDVFEVGNTDAITLEAASVPGSGLADLSSFRAQLGGGTSNTSADPNQLFLASLNDSSMYNGKLFAVPYYAGDRFLMYRADLFKKSGIDPTTLTSKAAIIAAAQKLSQDNKSVADFSGFYLPGQDWYSLIQMVWDEGGQIATQDSSGKWTANLESSNSEKGIQDYVDYYTMGGSTGPKNNDEDNPPEPTLFQQGKIGMMITLGWNLTAAIGKTGAVTSRDQIGILPIPSVTAGKTVPVFLGGSDIGINAKSQNLQAAIDWASEIASPAGQSAMIGEGWIPSLKANAANIPDIQANKDSGLLIEAQEAAAASDFTPNSTKWGAVEANNPIKSMMTSILSGQMSVDAAAKQADQTIDGILNQS
jgi:N,N'-diacetylchitobiose transport system substrate-binding protein